jgi:hypothetical protein
MRFSLKDFEVDIRSRDQTYGLPCHSGRMALSQDVRPECDRETLFSPAVSYLLFPYSRVALVEI